LRRCGAESEDGLLLMKSALVFTWIAVAMAAGTQGAHADATLAAGFVYLRDIDGSILQDIRYAGPHNFVGRPIDGYAAAECILTESAARALAAVQAELAPGKLSLVVWDCYRPTRAVADFLRWSRNPADDRMKREFFPGTDKSKLFSLGYLATHSAHSRGSTVDLGIVPKGLSGVPDYSPDNALLPCTARKGERFEDGTIDLGSGYDCLDAVAGTSSPAAGRPARDNRQMLRARMEGAGFRPYAKEWWHFELVNEPFPRQSFDFPISPRDVR
jgi:D-alanyl-D-alanine dipeptidase